MNVYRPIVTEVLYWGPAAAGFPSLVVEDLSPLVDVVSVVVVVVVGSTRTKSPRMQTSGWMTDRPARIICWVPTSWFLRATLLPVSVSM